MKKMILTMVLSTSTSLLPTTAFADRVPGFDRFKFGMTIEDIHSTGPGCRDSAITGPNSRSEFCNGIRTATGGLEFYFDSTSKRLNGIRVDVEAPATEGDTRDLISYLSNKYKPTYRINDGDIPTFFSNRQDSIAVLGAWENYSVVAFVYRYGSARQYVEM